MPYISDEDRIALEAGDRMRTPGDLAYIVASEVDRYLKANGLSYQTLAEVTGVLETAKLEVYRRIAAPYEDEKRAQNGEVYSEDFAPEPIQLEVFERKFLRGEA